VVSNNMMQSGLEKASKFATPFYDVHSFRDLDQVAKTKKGSAYLDRYLCDHASQLFESSGNIAHLVPDHKQPGREILDWRWLSITLPPDLLVAGADIRGSATRVQVLDPTLRVLEPLAHLHIHATAAVPFAAIWWSLGSTMNFGGVKTVPFRFQRSYGGSPAAKVTPEQIEEWRSWLRRAFIGGHVLDLWMQEGYSQALQLLRDKPQLQQAIAELRTGRIHNPSALLEADISGTIRHLLFLKDQAQDYAQSFEPTRDPAEMMGRDPAKINSDEISFIRRCLRYMAAGKGEAIDDFRCIWVQMTRIRVLLYKHLVIDPERPGLDAFAEHFDHLGEYQNEQVENFALTTVCREPGLQLEHVELRKAPGGYSKLKKLQHQSESAKKECNIRWVLHFIRDDKRAKRVLQDLIRHHSETAVNLAATLRTEPLLLKSIRGIDVASRELAGPLWTVTWALDHVREESRRIASSYRGIKPLGLTVHVGEDFKHLLSGLRSVHEPYWWELMRRGDRLGHALALGLDPEQWRKKYPEITMPRCVRVLDLAWVIDFTKSRPTAGVPSSNMIRMREELRDHLRTWDAEANEETFLDIARRLGTPGFWREIDGFLLAFPGDGNSSFWRLAKRFLDEYAICLQQEGEHDIISVATSAEAVGTLVKVRDELARLLARWRTPIEVNPSSNLFVGGLDHPLSQPLFHVDPFSPAEDRAMVITLSADDPASFATTLADEYAYAWAGLVFGAQQQAPSYAQECLEMAAKSSRRAVF
jgi:hypothetical protein